MTGGSDKGLIARDRRPAGARLTVYCQLSVTESPDGTERPTQHGVTTADPTRSKIPSDSSVKLLALSRCVHGWANRRRILFRPMQKTRLTPTPTFKANLIVVTPSGGYQGA